MAQKRLPGTFNVNYPHLFPNVYGLSLKNEKSLKDIEVFRYEALLNVVKFNEKEFLLTGKIAE